MNNFLYLHGTLIHVHSISVPYVQLHTWINYRCDTDHETPPRGHARDDVEDVDEEHDDENEKGDGGHQHHPDAAALDEVRLLRHADDDYQRADLQQTSYSIATFHHIISWVCTLKTAMATSSFAIYQHDICVLDHTPHMYVMIVHNIHTALDYITH